MKITPGMHHAPLERKREVDGKDPAAAKPGSSSASASGKGILLDVDPSRLENFVSRLRDMDPSDIHRVEELRQQINDGRYSAETDEVIDSLMQALDDGRAEL
ncbi:MAG: hypothetical protein EA401_13970 [Planctomycetota bacterium]|nr:MAG: hypothetical protein EA401_13970 [Planctomycetota bacterium]